MDMNLKVCSMCSNPKDSTWWIRVATEFMINFKLKKNAIYWKSWWWLSKPELKENQIEHAICKTMEMDRNSSCNASAPHVENIQTTRSSRSALVDYRWTFAMSSSCSTRLQKVCYDWCLCNCVMCIFLLSFWTGQTNPGNTFFWHNLWKCCGLF